MFTINIDRRPHRVDFKHENVLDCPVTYCIVGNHRFSALGTSVCDGINISKNRRRKIALRNALENANFDRAIRKRFWDNYFLARGFVS